MNMTRHVAKRMSQRGISKKMVDLVLDHGVEVGDKLILGRREARRLLEDLREQQRLLMKVIDKGGIVVVSEGGDLLTTYNCGRVRAH